jgi:hypothetical protein
MGIKNLNQYLIANCSNKSIQKIHLETLENKIIVIDVSIYLYKFLGEGALMENIYLIIVLELKLRNYMKCFLINQQMKIN